MTDMSLLTQGRALPVTGTPTVQNMILLMQGRALSVTPGVPTVLRQLGSHLYTMVSRTLRKNKADFRGGVISRAPFVICSQKHRRGFR